MTRGLTDKMGHLFYNFAANLIVCWDGFFIMLEINGNFEIACGMQKHTMFIIIRWRVLLKRSDSDEYKYVH